MYRSILRRFATSIAAFMTAVVLSPAMAASCDGFVDVNASASYCSAVSYLKDRGVTLGCTDSIHYCPNGNVTRAQMALYLQRMGVADSTNTIGDHTNAIGGGTHNSSDGGGVVVSGAPKIRPAPDRPP